MIIVINSEFDSNRRYSLNMRVNKVPIDEVKELKLSRSVLNTRNAMWEYAMNTSTIAIMKDINGLAMYSSVYPSTFMFLLNLSSFRNFVVAMNMMNASRHRYD